MRYTQFTDTQVRHMLGAIGATSIDDLFARVPRDFRMRQPLAIPRGVSEPELLKDLLDLSRKNKNTSELISFLGGGAYDHFVPTLVDSLAAQTEFVTGYTPYQAEASQGILQLFYEFQSMVCALTGMDVANASLYEVASATSEAMVMALSATRRSQVIIVDTVHPDTRAVATTYARERGVDLLHHTTRDGVVDPATLAPMITDKTAAVIIQSPNFFGCVERLDTLIPAIRERGTLAIVVFDPLASGMYKTPGSLGADIVVAEGQSLGIPLQYGGPYLGLLATREQHLRKMPGRVVGMTQDAEGRRAFCLALQTREQHIKRERATSNVCTNQGLLAIRASIHLAAMGKQGIGKVASLCFDKAHYAAHEIARLSGFKLRYAAPFFKEFVVQTTKPVSNVLEACRHLGILGGVPLGQFDPAWSDCLLVAVTEKRTKGEIDALVAAYKAA